MQDDRAGLEEELKKANQSIVKHTKKIKKTEEALEAVKSQERELQEELANIKRSWVSAEESRNLRKTAHECQERELQLSQRVATLSDDFCHLMERRDAVEAEMQQQRSWRRKVVALQQGLETIMKSMCALEKRCCEVTFFSLKSAPYTQTETVFRSTNCIHDAGCVQVSESQQGLMSWVIQSMDSAEAIVEGFMACAMEHDALLIRADMHAVHESVLQAARITAQAKSDVSPTKHAHWQMEHVQRLEQTIAKLRQDLEQCEASLASRSQAVHEAQQNVQTLQQVSAPAAKTYYSCVI